jgi:hypothetical protein
MIKAISILVLLAFAIPAFAGDMCPCISECGVSCSMRVTICPQGDFESLRDGCGTGRDYIWVHMVDCLGQGMESIPITDYWIQAYNPTEELYLCSFPIAADSATNSDGWTTISGPIAGGGCALTGGLYLAAQGNNFIDGPGCVETTRLNIVIVSPDLNADSEVNLSDLAVFGLSYNKSIGDPGYNDCCDFNDDTACNLSDFAFMGAHYQHGC